MQILFNKVILHNFLSYGHAEIELQDRNYCLVKGVNNDPADNALSNGAGKSSWSSAICWALTGETIQGIKSGIKNIFVTEDLCYVTLYFTVDGNKFEVTRYAEPKSDLRITINGQDKSGKGIKESKDILAQYLPDLTSQLLGSIIILGQGLPYKFTDNTPSGRKEVLEKLSKSDFMIQDIKTRLAKVIDENNIELRKAQDALLVAESQKAILSKQLEAILKDLEELEKPADFAVQIETMTNNINELNNLITKHLTTVNEAETKLKQIGDQLNIKNEDKNAAILKETTDYNAFVLQYNKKVAELENEFNSFKTEVISTLNESLNNKKTASDSKKLEYQTELNVVQAEIRKIQSIKDVCPTCGRPFENVVKPDTSKMESRVLELNKLIEDLNKDYESIKTSETKDSETKLMEKKDSISVQIKSLNNSYNGNTITHNAYLKQINEQYESDCSELNNEYRKLKQNIDLYSGDIKLKREKLVDYQTQLNKLKLEQQTHEEKLKKALADKDSVTKGLETLDNQILYSTNEKDLISERLDIDSKLNTLIKRDFRGFLLSNVISFIDAKAKDYCSYVFGTQDIDFTLDGNNIDIAYRGKAFDNLSGGEKQKVDLIIQFAIRDMMTEYLDFSSNILVLDEIFDNLDAIGCNNVINLISNKLNDVESLFIISHHADELEIPYDTEMTIVKNNQGVSEVL